MRVLHVFSGLSAAVIVLALNAPTGAYEPHNQTLWYTDFNQALEVAKQQNRPMLVHFHASFCGPCRRMEGESLNSPEVLGMVRNTFIGVKIDVEQYPDVAERYRVTSLPTDMVLGPNGGIHKQNSGYVPKHEYMAMVSPWEVRYGNAIRARQQAIAATPKPQAPTTHVSQGQERLPPRPIDVPQKAATTPPQVALNLNTPAATEPASAVPAMDGYCPVTLRQTRSWKKGRPDYTTDYMGQTYFFTGSTELATFKANPTRYAPRNLGCDPVVLSENDLAAPGTTKFGAYFDGELYLFKSADTRSRFKNDPLRYSRARHVLKPEELNKRRA